MRNMKLSIKVQAALILATIFLAGCETTTGVVRVAGTAQIVHTPKVNTDAEVEIGQTIISKANLTTYPAVKVNQTLSETIKQSLMNNRHSGTITINPGIYKKTSEDANGSFFPDPYGTFNFIAGTVKCTCGVYVPHDGKKSPVMFTYHTTIGATGFEFGVNQIDITKTISEVWSTDSFKKELVYGGLSQKTISISYREFSDGTARPAFTQDLKYDLSEGDEIGFRGARFQVIKASNTVLKYKVTKALD